MNVIYDISMFGVVQHEPKHSNGIYRVVDDLARALIRSGRCSLNFSAAELEWHNLAIQFANNSSTYKDFCFPHSAWRYKAFCQYAKADQRAEAAAGPAKILWRAARKLLRQAASLDKSKLIRESSLNWADIFHSMFFALPDQARGRKNIRIFLTVYDLIPILLPQYFVGLSPLKSIIDGIQAEDWVICISQRTKDDLCDYRKDIDPRRVFVTPLGASDWFYPCHDPANIETVRSKYKIPEGQYILSLCTLESRKNLAHLIRCFTRLVQQEPLKDLHLVLAGSLGWKYESILSELTGADGAIRERILLAGRVANEDMAALYSGATAFVYPSLYEGFGLPPLEAMQCGTPVITSNTSSLPEVVGNAGIMLDPHDTDGLCQAMLQVTAKPDLRRAMSQKSLEQAGRFSWSRCADQTLNAYQTAMSHKH